jgi:tripartite-type tricarboxylate transporter receptor subunit TctC
VNEILQSPEIVDEFAKQGLIVAGGAPEVLGQLIAKDLVKWRRVIQEAGITAE